MRSVSVTQVSLESLRLQPLEVESYKRWNWSELRACGASCVWGWASTESNCGTQGAAVIPFKAATGSPCLKVHEWDPIFSGGEIFKRQQIYGNTSLFGLRVCLKVLTGFMPSPKFKILPMDVFLTKTAREWTCLYTCEMEIYPCKYYNSHH